MFPIVLDTQVAILGPGGKVILEAKKGSVIFALWIKPPVSRTILVLRRLAILKTGWTNAP